ncbi:hypothetical protein ELY33_00890 [Vreelandella andesensis]|uniref:Uncharacterized protein n=1 Tax=Vreelandella andesensis TaxID=447567 RepID=A0A3S0Y0M1_9GAMM|nr:hypothetical protein [Halomonas andesensis]RUR34769.1 hypothetical protein ELY33_00890 [Halomonas andesensis]
MATRPLFVPIKSGDSPGVEVIEIDFQWFPGMSKSQKQKSVVSFHKASEEYGFSPVLEVSSKSLDEIGVALSAFNLMIETNNKRRLFSVESAFQSSKVFEKGGPYRDLLEKNSREAKKDVRLKESGEVIGFNFFGKIFPIEPKTFFYDWLYINALQQNKNLSENAIGFSAFTDIEFNPNKSINCQAYSLAFYVSMVHFGLLEKALSSSESFYSFASANLYRAKKSPLQDNLL